jgi:prevent-host-death family protein
MSHHSLDEAKENLQQLVDQVVESHSPIVITSKRKNAVLVSEEDWESIQETLYLLSVPGMRESIQAGLATPIEDCSEELDW